MKSWAPCVLRIGISLVFLWFGFQQLNNTEMWTGLIRDYATNISGLSAFTLVTVNGAFEMVFGLILLLGIYTRLAAALLALHMIHIVITVGYSAIGVRDFAITIATITIFLNGMDCCGLDWKFGRKEVTTASSSL